MSPYLNHLIKIKRQYIKIQFNAPTLQPKLLNYPQIQDEESDELDDFEDDNNDYCTFARDANHSIALSLHALLIKNVCNNFSLAIFH